MAKRDLNQLKDLFNQFVSFAGQSKNEVIQTLCQETGKAIAEALKGPLTEAMNDKKLNITLHLENTIPTKKPRKTPPKKKKKTVRRKS